MAKPRIREITVGWRPALPEDVGKRAACRVRDEPLRDWTGGKQIDLELVRYDDRGWYVDTGDRRLAGVGPYRFAEVYDSRTIEIADRDPRWRDATAADIGTSAPLLCSNNGLAWASSNNVTLTGGKPGEWVVSGGSRWKLVKVLDVHHKQKEGRDNPKPEPVLPGVPADGWRDATINDIGWTGPIRVRDNTHLPWSDDPVPKPSVVMLGGEPGKWTRIKGSMITWVYAQVFDLVAVGVGDPKQVVHGNRQPKEPDVSAVIGAMLHDGESVGITGYGRDDGKVDIAVGGRRSSIVVNMKQDRNVIVGIVAGVLARLRMAEVTELINEPEGLK